MIELAHFPFALSLLPFLGFGICLPASLKDLSQGRLMNGDAIGLVIGFIVVAGWYWAILHSVRVKRRAGKPTLLGRELDSWLWAPPLAFVVGLAGGLSLLFV